ncbi:YigZ family protein [Isoptericola halotolerans]|uniref:YigZ family protein n=1 Tax=Isoptericola halotolerans TaxID=300560 RepID=A0ABX2A664_9MICO|nr:YigZ family protein [Isoptericola halotolerans]NOV98081.1 putative YigZ family protein [Isoptericola halotolerans]
MSSRPPSTLASGVEHELVVKRSRFLTYLSPATTEAAVQEAVRDRRALYRDARHHCVASVLGPHGETRRSSDDGEPAGTAGVPMLEVLRHREMTDVVAVVTRYFGGVLLGAGGLVRAYSGAVASALDAAVDARAVLRRQALVEVTVDAPHTDAGRLEHRLREWAAAHGAVTRPTRYADSARLTLLVPRTELDRLHHDVASATAGSVVPHVGDEQVVDVPR